MKKKVILIFGSLITLLVVFSFVITSQGYTVGKDPFNGEGYDLKDKEFNYGTTYWSISGGNGNSYSSGRIGKCLKVTGSSDITISQKISSGNLAFVKNRYFSFGVFFKGTKSGDELRVSIKYRYEVRTRYGYRVFTSYQYSDWEKKSQFSDKPWVLVTTNKKIPSTTFEITVRIHVRNTNGYSKVVYIDPKDYDKDFSFDKMWSIFKKKCQYKKIPVPKVDDFFLPQRTEEAGRYWERGLAHQVANLADYRLTLNELKELLTKSLVEK